MPTVTCTTPDCPERDIPREVGSDITAWLSKWGVPLLCGACEQPIAVPVPDEAEP
jgi:hypothetical protein